MPTETLTPEIRRGGEVSGRRFDPRSAAPFVYKSTSEETRRAYRRTLLEFFRFVGMKHPCPHLFGCAKCIIPKKSFDGRAK
jgi:hypothetical protein